MSNKASSGGKKVSQGLRQSTAQKTLNGMKADRHPADKLINIQAAWKAGSNPWVTIDNPNREETNKRKIRVRVNDLSLSYKERETKRFIMT